MNLVIILVVERMVVVVVATVDVEEGVDEVAVTVVVDEEEEAVGVDHPFAVEVDEVVGEAAVTVGEAVAADEEADITPITNQRTKRSERQNLKETEYIIMTLCTTFKKLEIKLVDHK
mmetsp:Transcript_12638/g.22882  ORF Transcript_12638/g.22882 Transcript_12638/m.22882 type:complete len:117 (+) Transcript_12638:677-1027(+)